MDSATEAKFRAIGWEPLPEPSDRSDEIAEYNAKRHYDHLHEGCALSLIQYSDREIGNMVRMLMRGDWNHEIIVTAARDRIFCLEKEKRAIEAQNSQWQQSFSLYWNATIALNEMWRDEMPDERELVLNDAGKLCRWAVDRIKSLEAELADTKRPEADNAD